jgi:nucleotide-binding universal stress UspA family protein
VLARNEDQSRHGPRSLGPTARYVVDHAPCAVLLVWPDTPSG